MMKSNWLTADRPLFLGYQDKSTRETYLAVSQRVRQHDGEIFALPHPMDVPELARVADDVFQDTHLFFGALPWIQYYANEDNPQTATHAQLMFYLSRKELQECTREIEQRVSSIVETANSYPDKIRKLLFLVGWLVENVEYSGMPTSFSDIASCKPFVVSQSTKGAFLDRKATCLGFSRALAMLCGRAGIECSVVVGKCGPDIDVNVLGAQLPVNHAWNMVILDGRPYYVDICASQKLLRRDEDIVRFPFLMDTKAMFDFGYSPFIRPLRYSKLPKALERCRWGCWKKAA